MTAKNILYNDTRAIDEKRYKIALGGLVSVRTYACNEIQVRICSNLAALLRRDKNKPRLTSRRECPGSLVLCRESQTFPKESDSVILPRSRKFSAGARHLVRESVAYMEERYAKNVLLITLTLPGSTEEAVRTFAAYDKPIKNSFLQNFRKLIRSREAWKGSDFDYCLVSEMQERGAIHFHIAVGVLDEKFEEAVRVLYRRWWSKLIRLYSRKTGRNLAMSHDGHDLSFKVSHWLLECARVEKSVANYLAKYVSKAQSKAQVAGYDTPSRWWQVSSSLRAGAMSRRKTDSILTYSWQQAKEICENVARVLSDNAVEFKAMYNGFTGEALGIVFHPPKERQSFLFEWISLLIRNWKTVVPKTQEVIFADKELIRM